MVQNAETIWRDFVTDGVPASGKHDPRKVEIREWAALVETGILGGSAGSVVFASKAALDGSLGYAANTMAWVIGDATVANNGIYQKTGASGAGAWVRRGDLPYSFIRAANVDDGTPNAVIATTSLPIPAADGAALITVNVTAENTGPATISFNGAAPLNIVTSSGNPIQSGYALPNMLLAGFREGGNFRLINEIASAAIIAQVEQMLVDAQAAAAAAQAAASSVILTDFPTKSAAQAYSPEVSPLRITVAGSGYVKVETEPSHEGKLFITLADGSTVVWFELDVFRVTPEMFDTSNPTLALQNACLYAILKRGVVIANSDATINSVDLTGVSGGSLKIRIGGTLTHQASATGDMFIFGEKDSVEVCGTGKFDGNHINQTAWVNLLSFATVRKIKTERVDFTKVKQYAIAQQGGAACEDLSVAGHTFTDGALHNGLSGALARFCVFVMLRGGENNKVKSCRFIQTSDPVPGHNKNPAAIVGINTGSTVSTGMLEVGSCYFENLGFSSNGNHLCPLDVYSYIREFSFKGNVFRKSRIIPMRVTNFGVGMVENNNILDNVQQYFNDTTLYADAAMMSFAIVDRGYLTDQNDVHTLTIQNNVLEHSGGFNANGISLSCSSSTNIFHLAELKNNRIISTGANSGNGVFVNCVKAVDLAGNNEIRGFSHGIRAQQTSNLSPLSAEARTRLTVRGGVIGDATFGIRADLDVANLHVVVDGVALINNATSAIRVRLAAQLNVKDCDAGGGQIDATNTARIFVTDNGRVAAPIVVASSPFTRIRGNQGVADSAVGA